MTKSSSGIRNVTVTLGCAGVSTTGSSRVRNVTCKPVSGRETWPDGTTKALWSGLIAGSGKHVLHGPETWFHPDGRKAWEATWHRGSRTGAETCWREDGSKAWEWERRPDGTAISIRYWRNGKPKSRSHWRAGKAEGEAVLWDYTGREIARHEFRAGELIR